MFDKDQRLLRRLRAGDTEAYIEAAKRFHREVWAYLYRLTCDYDLAEDLAQEVAIRFWQAAPEFRDVSSLKAWIYKVAHNLFVTHYRVRQPECIELDESLAVTSQYCSPEELLDRRLLREEIDAALSRLPEDRRRAVILTKMQGLKLREAAEVMEMPLGTVQWLVHQGLKQLREILLKEGADHVFTKT